MEEVPVSYKGVTSNQVECPRCHVPAGERCLSLTTKGARITNPHVERTGRALIKSGGVRRKTGYKPPHVLRGKVFGALKVICRWGPQSGNVAWVYWCRACGHVSKRLGITLVRAGSRTRCPSCKETGRRQNYPHGEPDPGLVGEIMEDASDPPRARAKAKAPPRRRPVGVTRRLARCTVTELSKLGERIRLELESRAGEVVREEG